MNKTLEVIRFEIVRSLKKPSFWIAAILIPVGFALYIAFASFSGYNAEEAISKATDTSDSKLAILDESGYIKVPEFVNSKGEKQSAELVVSKDEGIENVKNKTYDIFYYIPSNFAETKKVEAYTKPEKSSLISDYSSPIKLMLNSTAMANIDPIDLLVITGQINVDTTTFDNKDDHVIDSSERIQSIIGPAIGLACFYILMIVLGQRLTAAMVEEKENRISELILTSVKPAQLMFGKVVSLMVVGIIQLLVLVLPILALYKIAQGANIFPENFNISLDVMSILQYLLFLIVSYFLFTAMSLFIGVISPTAKDANSYSSFMVIMVILPVFFISALMVEPTALSYFLSYFPPSAPIAIMLRAVFGNLQAWEYWVGLAEIALVGALVVKLDSHIFRKNAIEFTSKINFKNLLSKPRKSWKK